MGNFQPLEVVGLASETQLQIAENTIDPNSLQYTLNVLDLLLYILVLISFHSFKAVNC